MEEGKEGERPVRRKEGGEGEKGGQMDKWMREGRREER